MPDMTNVDDLVLELVRRTKYQTPPPGGTTYDDYFYDIQSGIRRLYVDTGRYLLYDPNGYVLEPAPLKDDPDRTIWFYKDIFPADETMYILKAAEIEFYQVVQAKVNDQVSYSTDGLSVTHGDKPYANLGATIDRLERELRKLFYKMVRYGM